MRRILSSVILALDLSKDALHAPSKQFVTMIKRPGINNTTRIPTQESVAHYTAPQITPQIAIVNKSPS